MSEREHVRGMKKQTDNKYLNMYELNAVDKNGREHPYLRQEEKTETLCVRQEN